MPDYKSLYFALFNSITDAIETLKKVQQDAEDLYISDDEAESQESTDKNNAE